MKHSKIEWTDTTWNPVRGCSRISEGCRNCYAERMAARFAKPGEWAHGFAEASPAGPRWTGKVALAPEKLDEPLTWSRPRRIFVNSMSDLFHEDLPDIDITRVFLRMREAEQHTFQVLTKRADRMLDYMRSHPELAVPNVWLGVSVEDQAAAGARIPLLLQTPASVRFLSVEPLLGEVGLSRWLMPLDWVIVGGESGPGARPCRMSWVRAVVNQCRGAGTPVFVKQLGARAVDEAGVDLLLHHSKGGDQAEWPEDLRIREFPKAA